MQKNVLYRAIKEPKTNDQLIYTYRETMRIPINVPYIVDNLWEWTRPEIFPCRRHSAYASPNPQLALESAQKGSRVYRVKFLGQVSVAQLKKYSDSKNHPDCKQLKKRIVELLKESTGEWWPNWNIEKKNQVGQLWMPCLRKSEMDYLFAHVKELTGIRSEIFSLVSYWNDVEIINLDQESSNNEQGEIFFEAKDGYQLIPI